MSVLSPPVLTATTPPRIVVTPPPQGNGIADILVALGDARIAVTHAEPSPDGSDTYILMLDQMGTAVRVLTNIGCVVHVSHSPRPT